MDSIEVEVTRDLEDIVPGYLERLVGTVARLETLLAAGDFAEVKKLGHNLKGSGGGYGFAQITRLGAVIEDAAKAENASSAGTGIAELKDFASRVTVKFV